MAHQLAEAICELAAPPLQPSFIRILAHQGDLPALTLLLHVHPRPLAAGLEIAVYSGFAELEENGQEATSTRISRHGAVYAVPCTPAGMEQFVSDLVALSPGEWGDGEVCQLELPRVSPVQEEWTSVVLHLLPPSAVQARPHEGPQPPSPTRLRVGMPTALFPDEALAAAEVDNRAARYASSQEALRQAAAASTGSRSGAAAAARPQPDSQTEFQAKYRRLRDEVMAELKTALLTMLRQALRFHGTLEFPGAPSLLPAAAAGAAGQAGAQAGNAAGP